ncbi:MAG TPA: DUF6445 family protein [Steroidobacteraceae bacterium]|nr:DUF6445 family protein [Steroidobacteraceae bacterium]
MTSEAPPALLFNPRATVQVARFDERHFCLVVDEALRDPDQLVEFAAERSALFSSVDFSYYPGVYLMAPAELTARLTDYFQLHARRRFDARRCVETICRYSIATLPSAALRPIQWLCHRDDVGLDARLSMQASVLYLFRDPELGGTGFYVPTRSAEDTAALFADTRLLSSSDFATRYGLSPGYMRDSNAWFRRIGGVAAKWNRLIIYDGGMLHASDIAAPSRLSPDPRQGRLTLNGFFTCRRNLR